MNGFIGFVLTAAATLIFAAGLELGASSQDNNIHDACAKYGQYKDTQYKMTCVKIKE